MTGEASKTIKSAPFRYATGWRAYTERLELLLSEALPTEATQGETTPDDELDPDAIWETLHDLANKAAAHSFGTRGQNPKAGI